MLSSSPHIAVFGNQDSKKKMAKTYNSGDSPVVTHLTTSPPVHRLSTAERTGSAVFRCPMVVCEKLGELWPIDP
jgi:hypothetical protein